MKRIKKEIVGILYLLVN